MFTLILFLTIGSVLAYLSHNNLMPVTLNLGSYVFSSVPLFYVIMGSLLIGLGFSYFIGLISSISHSFVLRGKDNQIKKNKDEVLELTKRIHQLELEKQKLKNNSSPEDEDAL